jgi:hypothetical protein
MLAAVQTSIYPLLNTLKTNGLQVVSQYLQYVYSFFEVPIRKPGLAVSPAPSSQDQALRNRMLAT